jgi:hypothetical protein
MPAIQLIVPAADHSLARALGATDDPAGNGLLVPAGVDATPFVRWLPVTELPNIRSSYYYIATTTVLCERCRGPSPIVGLALPPGHETLEGDDETDEEFWQASEDPTFVCYLDYLLPTVAARVVERSATYRYSYRRRTQSFYWANRCAYCDAKLGDYESFCEPGQGFTPLTREDAAAILLERINEPFAATSGGWSLGVELFEFMTFR